MFTLTLSSYFGSPGESWSHINVVINWQLSNRVSADRYHLTVSRAQVIAGSRLVFLNSYQICCVYLSIAPHFFDFDFKLTSDAKIQPVFLQYRREDFFLPWSRVGHAPRPMFMLWLVQIWQVSSSVKFVQHLESGLPLTAEADRVLTQLVMFLTVFFHWMYKMKYSCYQESSLIVAGLFIGFLVEECVACQSR